MQLVHLDTAAHRPAASPSMQAGLAVAGVVGCVGGPGFGSDALRMLNAALPLCWWSVYTLYTDRPPRLHAGGSYQVPDRTGEAFTQYRQGLYRVDPTFAAARERLEGQGGVALTWWRAEEIPARHRGAIYTRHALRERVSLVRAQADGGLIAINMYRHERQPSFTDRDFDLLGCLAAPLGACVDLHLRAQPQPADCLRALPRREREVCERLLRGWTHEGIAADLGISAGTVKTYRDRAFERLGVRHRNELFALALGSLGLPSKLN